MSIREEVIRLVEAMPETDLAVARRVLEGIALTSPSRGPESLRAFPESCPEDDEPTTEDDLAAIARGREAFARGELISHDEVARRAGKWPA